MHQLPADRKLYLLEQHRQYRVASAKSSSHVAQPATYGPSSAGNLLPRLVPHLSGDSGFMRRLSITGWGGSSASSPLSASGSKRKDGKLDPSNSQSSQVHGTKATEEHQPLQPQTTGGLWSSWWVSSGGEKTATLGKNAKEAETPKWYVDRIKGKTLDTKLVKNLISLRVHLSTARVFWVKEFVETEAGLDGLSAILASLVGRAGKRKHLSDMEGAVLLEIIKILRVLSNTEVS